MNEIGRQAQAYCRRWRPNSYRELADPEAFFTAEGERVGALIAAAHRELASEDVPPDGDSPAAREARLDQARERAQEQILARELYLPAEVDTPDDPAPPPLEPQASRTALEYLIGVARPPVPGDAPAPAGFLLALARPGAASDTSEDLGPRRSDPTASQGEDPS